MLNEYISKASNYSFSVMLHITDKLINAGSTNTNKARILIGFNLLISILLKWVFKTTVYIEPVSFIVMLVLLQMMDFTKIRSDYNVNVKGN